MDCERFDRNSLDLLYGELDELSEAASLRHLHHCTRCREIWGHLRTTREVAQLPQEEPPENLFEQIIDAERVAHRNLPVRERFSRAISVLAGYAMRPQLAMAALLVLMVGSGLIFVRAQPLGGTGEHMRVVERGVPSVEQAEHKKGAQAVVIGGDPEPHAQPDSEESDRQEASVASSAQSLSEQGPSDKEVRARGRAAYSEAMTAYQQGRYAEAERLFSEIASGGGEQSASAALHEGHAARNGSGCQRAAKIYDAVAERQVGGTIAHEASWHAAACYRAMGQLDRAISHYRKLASKGAFSKRAQLALAELVTPQAPSDKGAVDEKTSPPPATAPTSKTLPIPNQKQNSDPTRSGASDSSSPSKSRP